MWHEQSLPFIYRIHTVASCKMIVYIVLYFLKPNTGKLKNDPQQWVCTRTAKVIECLGVGNIEKKVQLPNSLLICST